MENETITPQDEPQEIQSVDLHDHHMTQKHSQKMVFGVLIIFVIAAIAGAAYYLGTQNSGKMVPPTNVTPVPTEATMKDDSETANWESYGDSSITIKAPSDFSQIKESSSLDQQSPIISISSKKAEYFAPNYNQESIIVVGTIPNSEDCSKPADTNLQPQGEKEITGNTFTVFTSQDAGAGNRYDTTIYRTVNNQICYEIAQTVHTSSDWNGIDTAAADASVSSAKEVFTKVMTTFKML